MNATPQGHIRDQDWRTEPPQTVDGPHDRMRYFGLSGGTECVCCMDCWKVIPFTRAAEHQATHAKAAG